MLVCARDFGGAPAQRLRWISAALRGLRAGRYLASMLLPSRLPTLDEAYSGSQARYHNAAVMRAIDEESPALAFLSSAPYDSGAREPESAKSIATHGRPRLLLIPCLAHLCLVLLDLSC